MSAPRLLFGTSSFSEPSWQGTFYPEGTRPADYLAHYATQFPAVEVDMTYYRIPEPAMVEAWNRGTPDGFRICAKFPRSVVHAGDGPQPDAARVLVPELVGDDVRQFLDAMAVLGDKLGPLLVQLPFFAGRSFAGLPAFLARLEGFLAFLPDTFRYAVEVRNKLWIQPPLLDLLRRHRCALALVDFAYMPHPIDLAKRFDLVTAAGDFLYVRLIGDRKATEAAAHGRFDRIVVDQSRPLARWAILLQQLMPRVREVYTFANNHYAGHGPATIRDLVRRLNPPSDRD